MPDPTTSAPADTETPAERFKRIVLGSIEKTTATIAGASDSAGKTSAAIARLAATLDDAFPAAVIAPAGGGIDDDSAFYGADEMRPDFVARDDAAWRG